MPLIHLTDNQYREWLENHSKTPLWQSLEWKSYQERLGRETRVYGLKKGNEPSLAGAYPEPSSLNHLSPLLEMTQNKHCRRTRDDTVKTTALVVIDRTICGYSVWDIPRGPVGDEEYFEELIAEIIKEAKKEKCLAMYFSPASNHPSSPLEMTQLKRLPNQPNSPPPPAHPSSRHEQPEATVVLDLALSDEELLKQMKEKGRYNIRLAQKKGIVIQESDDIDAFYELLQATGARDGFGIKPKKHYEEFLKISGSFLLMAFEPSFAGACPEPSPLNHLSPPLKMTQNERCRKAQNDTIKTSSIPIAALFGITHNETGYYYYGASDYEHRKLMAPHLLQWEAIRKCRAAGCMTYDLLGIAPERSHEFGKFDGNKKHPWEGVTRFKKQFGGKVVTYPQEKMIMIKPIVKWIIDMKRRLIR